MHVGNRSDKAFIGQFPHAIDREDGVDIALPAGAIEIDRNMAHQDVAGREFARNFEIVATVVEKWLLAARIKPGGAQNGDLSLRKGRSIDKRLTFDFGTFGGDDAVA